MIYNYSTILSEILGEPNLECKHGIGDDCLYCKIEGLTDEILYLNEEVDFWYGKYEEMKFIADVLASELEKD